MTDRQRNISCNALMMGGLFITAGKDPAINVMTTHWGGFTQMWNREVFVLPVRKRKYTHELIEKNKCFVVNVPRSDMNNVIAKCDRMSGKGIDKFEQLNLSAVPAKSLPTITVGECGLIIECKVIFTMEMEKAKLDPIIAKDMYVNKESHTLFFGEIINTYIQKPKK